jgi:flagellar basal body-associated protein FliL
VRSILLSFIIIIIIIVVVVVVVVVGYIWVLCLHAMSEHKKRASDTIIDNVSAGN